MNKHNPKNERIKREYFRYQTEAKQKSVGTLNGIRKAIDRFEVYTGHACFSSFNKEKAIGFKRDLAKQKAARKNQFMSKSTLLSTVNHLKEFFQWIAYQPGYKSKIHVPELEYFNLQEKDVSIAKATKFRNFPTLEQIKKVIFSMPIETDIQRRNRALIAFTILTGMRDNAIASIRIRHIDQTHNPILVRQEPDRVRTKFSKQILTYFFPVGEDLNKVVTDWIKELQEEKLYGFDDPVFPRTRLGHDECHTFVPAGLEPHCWAGASSIRKIFKEAFEAVGLPYFHPHLFRKTLVNLGQRICKTPEEFKVLSQCLGHSSMLTTFESYGEVDPYRQGEVMNELWVKLGK